VPLIEKFLEIQIDVLDQDVRESMADLLARIKSLAQGFSKLPRSQRGETAILQKSMDRSLSLLKFA
jgi:hypothetical protein